MKSNRFSCRIQNPIIVGLFVLTTIVSGIACNQATDPLLDLLDTQLSNIKIDNLTRTMNFVVSPERFQKTQFEEKLAAALNRWATAESELMTPEDWSLDSMAKPLAARYESVQAANEMESLSFVNTDSYFLQQNFWAKKLGDRLVQDKELGPFEIYRVAAGIDESPDQETDDDPLATVLTQTNDGLNKKDAEQLSKSLKLFDWVVRNIHLLAEDSITSGVDDINEFKLNDAESKAAAGIPGLGYTRFPSHTLLFSRGDYVERAKVFMTMLNQQEIESVMLIPKTGDLKGKPWAVGVSIGDDLYLFVHEYEPKSPSSFASRAPSVTVMDSFLH